ncbi:MAG: type II toxin-antitoxin system RelE/ParE family toxin [Betaproteobacteria bacterium]|nr:type II toxin-antitoxin system RelE/ParE family toxin [Betaproteobacteria bacterium]
MNLATVHFTVSFEANLSAIEAFWADNAWPAGLDKLLDELTDTTVPNLERFPQMGRNFLQQRRATSVEALTRQEALQLQLAQIAAQAELREYLMQDYLVLYALVRDDVYLLSVRHHKQLSFDFAQHGGS